MTWGWIPFRIGFSDAKKDFSPLIEMTTGNDLWPCHFEEANATEKSFRHES